MTNTPKSLGLILALLGFFTVFVFPNAKLVIANTLFNHHHIVEWMGNTKEKVVTLTFDDGPDPLFTPAILKILRQYQIPATFFVTGENAQNYPELIKAELNEGHLIGNHTYNHPHLRGLTKDEINAELKLTDEAIRKAIGKIPLLFRSPYEEIDENILEVTQQMNKKIIMSTVTLEHHASKSPKAEAERVVDLVYPGAIILAHDGRLNRTQTVEALPYLIKGLSAKGYRFIALNKLLPINPILK